MTISTSMAIRRLPRRSNIVSLKSSPSWGTARWAIAALLQAEYIPPPLKSGCPCLGRSSICSFRWSVVTARLFPSPKVAAFLLGSQCEPSPSAAGVPNRRGYLFRLQACSDRPQGCVPRISPLARRCQNDAAGGEAASKADIPGDTFNGTPKPKQVPPPDKNVTRQRFAAPFPSLTSGS